MSDAPHTGRFDGRTHVLPVRVYYEDTDFTGVVYHANYLKFFERGRSEFLRVAGFDHQALLARDEPLGFVVLSIGLEFKRAARIDDALTVRTTFDRLDGARLAISQALYRGGDLIASAAVVIAMIDLRGRPKRFPKDLSAPILPYLQADD